MKAFYGGQFLERYIFKNFHVYHSVFVGTKEKLYLDIFLYKYIYIKNIKYIALIT